LSKDQFSLPLGSRRTLAGGQRSETSEFNPDGAGISAATSADRRPACGGYR
jgi:hypothetical protein